MTSLRASIATLGRFTPGAGLNVGAVAEFMRMGQPLSLRELAARIAALPESVPFHATIVTGAALGGEVSLTLNRDGSYRFHGFMRATGAPSFSFRVGVVVRGANTQVMVATQRSGEVFGSDTSGDRQANWDEVGTDPQEMKFIRHLWPDVSAGEMVVSRSSDLIGTLGTATDILKDVAKFIVVAETFGAGLAVCVMIGSELGDADVTMPGLGGIVGLGIVAGSLIIWGPLAIGPAIILGIAAGAVVDALVEIRRLRRDEEDFVRVVFGNTLDFDGVRITNMVGLSGRAFTMPTFDNHILVNIGVSQAMFDEPTTATEGNAYAFPGQLLIHEMTHAWQIQHSSLTSGYVPGWLCEAGVREQVFMGPASYNYGPPGPPWDAFTLEGQAHMVDDWFAATGRQTARVTPGFETREAQMSPDSAYFRYIDNNIRAGTT